jgi:hypothetical protein
VIHAPGLALDDLGRRELQHEVGRVEERGAGVPEPLQEGEQLRVWFGLGSLLVGSFKGLGRGAAALWVGLVWFGLAWLVGWLVCGLGGWVRVKVTVIDRSNDTDIASSPSSLLASS